MSEVLKSPAHVAAPKLDANWRSLRVYLPFLIPTLGASANRNQVGLEDRCRRLKSLITGEPVEVES